MANIKSARKRMRQARERSNRNRAARSKLRGVVKKHRESADSASAEALGVTFSEIDTAWRKGVIHKNAAARYKSRLAKQAASTK